MTRTWFRSVMVLAIVAATATLAPGDALAGCLSEYNSCERCARAMMRDAMFRFDLFGIRDANVAMWDCGIDLTHCLFYADHHEYACAT